MLLAKIFISYRRDDTPGSAGRLYDRLQQEFGRDNVFIDVTALQPGEDFVEAIDARLRTCDVMLAVIGRRWLTASDEHHGRRLDDSADHLRIELQTALDRGVRVIPVLVERATMPVAHELPEPLRPLARRQAFELRDTRWSEDITLLVDAVNRLAPASVTKAQVHVTENGESGTRAPRALWWPAVAIVTFALVVSLAAVWLKPNSGDKSAHSTAEGGGAATSATGKAVADRLQSQCDGADAFVSCLELANMYLLGRGVTRDYVRAVALYSKACEAGNMIGCRDLGGMYADGQGVERDEARGVALYRRACDGGDPSGCLNLGYMYQSGRGVPKDDMLARPLYEMACNNGEPIGCRNLGNFYLGGRGGLTRDEARGQALLQKACKGGDDTACLQLEGKPGE
jgi:TPR repeat protein